MTTVLQWFSGGSRQYLPIMESLHGDMLTVWILALLSAILFVGYIAISYRWRRDEMTVPHGPASLALAKLKWIFIISAFSNYGFMSVRMIWPAYRLQIILLGPLAYLAWSFFFKGGIRDVYVAMKTVATEHESLESMRAALDNLPSLAWTARPDGYIDWYNLQWYKYTGTTFEQMKGWGWQSVHHPDELPRVMEKWNSCIATGSAFEEMFPLRNAEGRFRWFLTRVTPVKNADGKVVRWYGGNTDADHLYRGKKNAEKLTIDDFIAKMNAFAEKA